MHCWQDDLKRGYESYRKLADERIEIILDLLVEMGITHPDHDLNAQGDITYLLDEAKTKIRKWKETDKENQNG